MTKKQTTRKILPTLPDDWWDRTPDELVLDAPGKMELNHTVQHGRGFVVSLIIAQENDRLVTFTALGLTMRDGIRKVELAAMAAGLVERRGKR
jgi:hypothetical protein